jgi:membrane associated rhomboid family serine protease
MREAGNMGEFGKAMARRAGRVIISVVVGAGLLVFGFIWYFAAHFAGRGGTSKAAWAVAALGFLLAFVYPWFAIRKAKAEVREKAKEAALDLAKKAATKSRSLNDVP